MLTIRLSRIGKKKQPYYRLVISEKRKDPWGDYLELLGNYNPRTKEINLKVDRIKHWLSVGAQPSNTVSNLLVKEGVIEDGKKKSVSISKKRKGRKEKSKIEDQRPKPAPSGALEQSRESGAEGIKEPKAEEKVPDEKPKEKTKIEDLKSKTEDPKAEEKEKAPEEKPKTAVPADRQESGDIDLINQVPIATSVMTAFLSTFFPQPSDKLRILLLPE